VREYLLAKVHKEFPDEKLEGVQAAYRLLHLIPDTLDLRTLILDLYAEQVAGYYDPDSSLLYAVQGADRAQLRLIMAHELARPPAPASARFGDGARGGTAIASRRRRRCSKGTPHRQSPGAGARPGGLAAADFWRPTAIRWNQQQTMPVFSQAPLVLKRA
jgi:hypothetical protein